MAFVVIAISYHAMKLSFNLDYVWICRHLHSAVAEKRGDGPGDIWGGDVL